MEVRIRDPRTNSSLTVEVEPDHTIEEITGLVMDEWKLEAGNYFLVLTSRGVILKKESEIGDTEIEEDDELILIPDPQGGAQRPQQQWKNTIVTQVEEIRSSEGGIFEILSEDFETDKYTTSINIGDTPAYRKTGDEDPEIVRDHKLELTLGRGFPESPPSAEFTSDVFHPNVFSGGRICIQTIDNWSENFRLIQLIKNIERLLWSPELDDAADEDAEQYYREHPLDPPERPWIENAKPPVIIRKSPIIVRKNGPIVTGPKIVSR